MSNDFEFFESSDFPDILSNANKGLSIDVFVYSDLTKEHTIGWFDYNKMTWRFLCREPQPFFKWRYFNEKTDTY